VEGSSFVSNRIRVATLNVWGPYGDWPARREVLRAGFAELDPDLVVLQETVVRKGTDQARELFGDVYHVLHQGRRAREGVGCSIVSRWPADAVEEVDLLVTDRVDPDDFVGRATLAEYDTPVGRVLVAHHKPNWQITHAT
jgi:exonuclease III